MKRSVSVTYDPDKKAVLIGTDNGADNPWDDLFLLLEGIGVLTTVCVNAGKTEHNGLPLDEYLKSYIDKVFADYKRTLTVVK